MFIVQASHSCSHVIICYFISDVFSRGGTYFKIIFYLPFHVICNISHSFLATHCSLYPCNYSNGLCKIACNWWLFGVYYLFSQCISVVLDNCVVSIIRLYESHSNLQYNSLIILDLYFLNT